MSDISNKVATTAFVKNQTWDASKITSGVFDVARIPPGSQGIQGNVGPIGPQGVAGSSSLLNYAALLTGQTITSDKSGYFIQVNQGTGNSISLFGSNTLGYVGPIQYITIYNNTGSNLNVNATLYTITTYTLTTFSLTPALYYPFNYDTLNYSSGSGVSNGSIVASSCQVSSSSYKYGSGSLLGAGSNSISSYFKLSNSNITNNNGYTFAFWIQLTSTTLSSGGYILNCANYFGINVSQTYMGIDDNYGNSWNTSITLDTSWKHITITISKNSITKIYVNGTLAFTLQLPDPPTLIDPSTGNLYTVLQYADSFINTNSSLLQGIHTTFYNLLIYANIDEFFYFDGIITSADITKLLNNNFVSVATNYGGFIGPALNNSASILLSNQQTVSLNSKGTNWIQSGKANDMNNPFILCKTNTIPSINNNATNKPLYSIVRQYNWSGVASNLVQQSSDSANAYWVNSGSTNIVVQVSANISFSQNANGLREIYIYHSVLGKLGDTLVPALPSNPTVLTITVNVPLAPNENFTINFWQNSGSLLSISDALNYMSIVVLSS